MVARCERRFELSVGAQVEFFCVLLGAVDSVRCWGIASSARVAPGGASRWQLSAWSALRLDQFVGGPDLWAVNMAGSGSILPVLAGLGTAGLVLSLMLVRVPHRAGAALALLAMVHVPEPVEPGARRRLFHADPAGPGSRVGSSVSMGWCSGWAGCGRMRRWCMCCCSMSLQERQN
jgi:hypothetical protein